MIVGGLIGWRSRFLCQCRARFSTRSRRGWVTFVTRDKNCHKCDAARRWRITVSVLRNLLTATAVGLFLLSPQLGFAEETPSAESALNDCAQLEDLSLKIRGCTLLLDRAEGVSPELKASLYLLRCIAYERTGEFNSAIADCSAAIALDPRSQAAHHTRGRAYFDKGELDLSVLDDTEAIKIGPKDAELYVSRGATYGTKGDYDLAITDFDEAIKLNPEEAKAFLNRGAAYANKGDKQQAIADFRQALALDPSLEAAARNLKALGAGAAQ